METEVYLAVLPQPHEFEELFARYAIDPFSRGEWVLRYGDAAVYLELFHSDEFDTSLVDESILRLLGGQVHSMVRLMTAPPHEESAVLLGELLALLSGRFHIAYMGKP